MHRLRAPVAPGHQPRSRAPREVLPDRAALGPALVALVTLVCQHLTVARLAEALAVSWDTANSAVLAEGQRHGHRGSAGDPLYRACRTLHTGHDLLTDRQRQRQRLTALFGVEDHVQVEATWGTYQRMISAYREPDRSHGKQVMTALIESVGRGVPAALTELRTLGRTPKKRAEDVLAYFDRPGTSNGPTEAMNGRLEHLRGSALGFRNLTNYIARSLLETGGFRPRLHPQSR